MFKLLIVGGTGLVGREVLRLALDDARISRVVAITRRPIASHSKLENHVVDFVSLPADASWWNVDAAVCALGTTTRETKSKREYHKVDVEFPIAIATFVKKNGAKAFAHVSSIGASVRSPFSYLKMKGEAEAGLSIVGFLSLTIVRPSFISGNREKTRLAESVFLAILRIVEPILPKRWHSVSAHRIALALLESVIEAKPGIIIRESETL